MYDNGGNLVFAYDLETTVQEDRTLVSNLAVIQCGESIHTFWATDEKTAADLLLEFLIQKSLALSKKVKIIALAHNARF